PYGCDVWVRSPRPIRCFRRTVVVLGLATLEGSDIGPIVHTAVYPVAPAEDSRGSAWCDLQARCRTDDGRTWSSFVSMVGAMGTGRSMECRHGRRDHSRTLRPLGVASRFMVDRFPVSWCVVPRYRNPLCLCAGVRAGAGLGTPASHLEPSLRSGQCRAAGNPGHRDHGGHRHRGNGDCDGVVGGTGVAPPNTGESTGGCTNVFLYRHSGGSSGEVRVVGRATDRSNASGTHAAGAFATSCHQWTDHHGRRGEGEGRQAHRWERGTGKTVVFHPGVCADVSR